LVPPVMISTMPLFIGFLEVAGLTPVQALEIVRGLRGLNIVGGDLVEASDHCPCYQFNWIPCFFFM